MEPLLTLIRDREQRGEIKASSVLIIVRGRFSNESGFGPEKQFGSGSEHS